MTSPNLAASQNVLPMAPIVRTLNAGENAIYTVPVGKAARLDKLVLTNVGGYPVTLSTSILSQGQAASRNTRVGATDYVLQPGDALTVEEVTTRWFPTGVTISVTSSTNDSITATLTGLEFA